MASNHLSVVDSIYLPLMVERPVTFAAKSEYFTGTRLAGSRRRRLPARDQPAVDRPGRRASRAGDARGSAGSATCRSAVWNLSGGNEVARRAAVSRPHRRGLPGPAFGCAGHSSRHGRHGADPAAWPPGATARARSRSGSASRSSSLSFAGSPPGPGSGAPSPTRSCRRSRSCPARNTCRSTPRSRKEELAAASAHR